MKRILVVGYVTLFLLLSCDFSDINHSKKSDMLLVKEAAPVYFQNYDDGCLFRGVKIKALVEPDTLSNRLLSRFFSEMLFDTDCDTSSYPSSIFNRPSFVEISRFFIDSTFSEQLISTFNKADYSYLESNKDYIFNKVHPIQFLYSITNSSLGWNKTPYGIYALWFNYLDLGETIEISELSNLDTYLSSLDESDVYIQLELLCFFHSLNEQKYYNKVLNKINCVEYKDVCEPILNLIKDNKVISFTECRTLLYDM